ncbi:oligosaccharide flippase family protein [Turicibacter sanguinis]|uniref:oligosaccharide flippase family protein n=1 Tax=Turicibacter sanguinis TaxID=154288 RepID=UPI0012BCDABC|nr:oligosaccharide flippase family protein [Turicibacter sanguinis]MDB8545641.1 oligosaccharide flippase family protein [Turicibacter sanguinis]MTO10813.1 oligosaccharide flippase family protein [Turicibacter sanguinis]MTP48348.1 oligosaccharide flippase family protein [Turicibacter sanguinis]MTP51067.1 oligosaccharide flippase family protein [Turicibacter sanguinis]MTQ08349.1 oligosaccharide flippase family protein [Turicibacter sanguinis]
MIDNMNNSNKQIKIGAIISYIAIIFNILVGFLYTPWLVKELGSSDYGIYTLALSVISFFLMDFGISGTISRFISIYRVEQEEEKVANLLGITYKLYLIIDILIFIILLFIFLNMSQIFGKLTPLEISKFKNVFLIIGGFSLISFPFMPLNGIFISYERFVSLKIFDLVYKITTILLIVLALSFGYGLYTLVLINAIVNIFIILIKVIYLKKNITLKINMRYKDSRLLKEILNFSVWMTIISIAQRLIINIAPSLLGVFSGSKEISIFAIGLSIEGYVWTFANALNGLFLPKVTRLTLNNKNKISEVTSLMIKVGRLQLFIIGIIIIGLIAMGKEFIYLWMGEEFNNSYYVAVLLITPGIITLTQEIAYNYLIALNEIKYRAYDFIGTAIISLILSIIFIPKWGAVGAALSAGIGIVIGHVIIMNIIYYKVFKIDTIEFLKQCHISMCIPFISTFIIAIIIQNVFPATSLIVFFIKATLVGLVYICLMWKLGFNNSERELFTSIIFNIKNKILG